MEVDRRRQFWTRQEEQTLIDLIEANLPYEEIAKAMGRSVRAITSRCEVLGVWLTTCGKLSKKKVAELLGVSSSSVLDWIRNGRLRAEPSATRRYIWQIAEEDLLNFLANSRFWIWWKPEKIIDKALREWCEEVRSGATFLTTQEVGSRLGYGIGQIAYFVREGRLPAMRYGTAYRFKEEDVERFVPPQSHKRYEAAAKRAAEDRLTRICLRCHDELPLREFYGGGRYKDELGYLCTGCQKQAERTIKGMKVCGSCKRRLPVTFFNTVKKNKDGLDIHCRQCHGLRSTRLKFGCSLPEHLQVRVEDATKPTHRVCTVCGEDKPIGQFYKNKKGPFGFCSLCIDCMKAKAKHYYRLKREIRINMEASA